MNLKKDVLHFLNNLAEERTYFFPHATKEQTLVGSMRGELYCFFVTPSYRKLTKTELRFRERITRSNGKYFIITSMEDLTELAKEKGWYDL
jgi:hypothetical protein